MLNARANAVELCPESAFRPPGSPEIRGQRARRPVQRAWSPSGLAGKARKFSCLGRRGRASDPHDAGWPRPSGKCLHKGAGQTRRAAPQWQSGVGYRQTLHAAPRVVMKRRWVVVVLPMAFVGAIMGNVASLRAARAWGSDTERGLEAVPANRQDAPFESLRSAPPDTTHYVRPLVPGESSPVREPAPGPTGTPPVGGHGRKR
jgi:hypothetical protein